MSIEDRMDALERRVNRYRNVAASLAVALVVVVTGAAVQEEKIPEVVRARRFEVTHKDNGERIEIRSNSVRLLDANGKVSAFLSSNSNVGGSISLYPVGGATLSSSSVSLHGGGVTTLSNSAGEKDVFYPGLYISSGTKDVVNLTYGARGGRFNLLQQDLEGKIAAGFGDSGAAIHMFNKTGERVVDLYADDYGMGYVGAFDRQGKGRTLTPR